MTHPTSTASQQHTVLIVEDEHSLLKVLGDKLTHAGFAVLAATNGEEGLHMALAHHPDILLLDILMPKMDGLQLLAELRKDTWGREVPVILLTNSRDLESVAQATSHGAYDYFVKSDMKLEDVVAKVKEKLRTKS